MAFMEKQVSCFSAWQVETSEGTECVPLDVATLDSLADYLNGTQRGEPEAVHGWFARLSAPGYMDCTEWSGPFETEKEAAEYLDEMYGDDDESEEG